MDRCRRHRLDDVMKRWIISYAKANHWGMAGWYDLEDLIQDGFVCYCRCLERYGHIRSQRHFMALVKTTYIRHVYDISEVSTKPRSAPDIAISSYAQASCFDTSAALEGLAGAQPEEQTFQVLMTQLPSELKGLFRILLNDAQSFPILRGEDGRRETTNDWLTRLAGLPKRYNVEAALSRHFGLQRSKPVPKAAKPLFYVDGKLFSR